MIRPPPAEEEVPAAVPAVNDTVKPRTETRKLSFKEKRELELLEKEMPVLEEEKKKLEESMASGTLNFEALQKSGERIAEIVGLLEEKEMRWLELSES
jgi:ATP-binding cassette subfamily F protein uup